MAKRYLHYFEKWGREEKNWRDTGPHKLSGWDGNDHHWFVQSQICWTTAQSRFIFPGCGLNVLNPSPIASLSQLIPPDMPPNLSIERTAAVIMSTFEPMWNRFLDANGRFDPFMDLYLERWLHSYVEL